MLFLPSFHVLNVLLFLTRDPMSTQEVEVHRVGPGPSENQPNDGDAGYVRHYTVL
jgi:hypothetical protein